MQIGEGAERWLKRAAAEGTSRIRRKMAEAVDLAKLHGTGRSTRHWSDARATAGSVTVTSRRVLAHQQQAGGELILFPARSEDHSLQRSTKSWEGFGR